MKKTFTWTLTLATVVALTACESDPGSSASPSASPSPSDSASASPAPSAPASATPTPSASAVTDPHPPFDELDVTTDGILPLTIGVPIDTNPGAEMVFLDEDHCYNEDFGITDGDLDRWIADYSLGLSDDGFDMRPFAVDVATGEPLWRIDIFSEDLTTPEGIGIGSTLAEVEAAYPDLVAGVSDVLSEIYWIEGDNGYVVFETQDDSEGFQPPGTPMTVILMRVISADEDPNWQAANSGNVAGACPF